jgi:hypothetical protein
VKIWPNQSNFKLFEIAVTLLEKLWRPIRVRLMSKNHGRGSDLLSITACDSNSWNNTNGSEELEIEIKVLATLKLLISKGEALPVNLLN